MTSGGEEEEDEVEEGVEKDELGAEEGTDVAMDVGDAR